VCVLLKVVAAGVRYDPPVKHVHLSNSPLLRENRRGNWIVRFRGR
jgi:hypothetical protein